MVREIAIFKISAGQEQEFEQFGEAIGTYLAGATDVRHIEPVG